jgi:hypothetical protein
MSPFIEYIVLRFDVARDCYEMVGTTEAANAGDAFRDLVIVGRKTDVTPGEYIVLPVEGSVRFGVELNLRVLAENGKPVPQSEPVS